MYELMSHPCTSKTFRAQDGKSLRVALSYFFAYKFLENMAESIILTYVFMISFMF